MNFCFLKNEYKQDLCSDNSDRVITLPFPIAYPIEYSTKKLFDNSIELIDILKPSLYCTGLFDHTAGAL